MSNQTRLRTLRLVLCFCALVWSVSALGIFLKWETAATALQALGAKPISYDPLLEYWLRMAAGAFTLLGTGCLLAALHPQKFAVVLPWLGWVMIGEGVILLIHGWRLGLPSIPFYGDVSASLAGGLGVLTLCDGAPAQP